ncbi:SRPBCC family protein [Streptomyces sp. NPDC059740]|uniref:SRPBCC family protein n=1 Tax=Streptomyces sp. NPDC059740 TaxID=3346926 RepID=UPI00365B6202
MTAPSDLVTGATAEVVLTLPLPPERLWGLVTDVTRYGEWSPECTFGAWCDPQAPGPRAGARFEGRNSYADGFGSRVLCVVTEVERPSVFAWQVLDGAGPAERPQSTWRYELCPAAEAGHTLIRQTFVHGPGMSGARDAALRDPGALEKRLATLRANMRATLTAMARAATGGTELGGEAPGASRTDSA